MTRRHESMSTNFDRLTVNTIRTLVADAVQKANSGHPGLAIGAAPMALSVFKQMRHNPANPSWRGRDRFVLSAGHASMLEYSLLHLSAMMYQLTTSRIFVSSAAKRQGIPSTATLRESKPQPARSDRDLQWLSAWRWQRSISLRYSTAMNSVYMTITHTCSWVTAA